MKYVFIFLHLVPDLMLYLNLSTFSLVLLRASVLRKSTEEYSVKEGFPSVGPDDAAPSVRDLEDPDLVVSDKSRSM